MKCLLAASLLALAVAVTCAADAPPPAKERMNRLQALLAAGPVAEARDGIKALREAYRAENDVEHEAMCLLLLAAADDSAGDLVQARAHYAEAAKSFRSRNDYFDAWIALAAAAQLEAKVNNYGAAISDHEEALAMLQVAAEQGDLKICIECLKMYASLTGKPAAMIDSIAAQPQLIRLLLPLFAPISHDTFATVLMEAGQLDKAEAQLNEASRESALSLGIFDTMVNTHMGDLRRLQWRLEEARTSYLKALESKTLLPSLPFATDSDNVAILLDLASVESLMGHIDQALAWNDKALQAVAEAGSRRREAFVRESRGVLLVTAGLYDRADETYERAKSVAQDACDDEEEASIEASIGESNMARGRYGAAATHFEKAISLYQGVHDAYLESTIWSLLATTYMLFGDTSDAESILATAWTLATKSEFRMSAALVEVMQCARDFFEGRATAQQVQTAFDGWLNAPDVASWLDPGTKTTLHDVFALGGSGTAGSRMRGSATPHLPMLAGVSAIAEGNLLLQRGDLAAARDLWRKALKVNSNSDLAVGYKALIGATYVKEGKADEALHWLTAAADAMETPISDLRVEEALASYLGTNRHVYYDLLVEMLLRRNRTEEAFDYAERARSRAFLQLVGNTRLKPDRGADPALVHETETLRTQLPLLRGEDLVQARRRYQTLLSLVKLSNPGYASVVRIDPVFTDAVQASLPEHTTLIAYYTSPVGTGAWVVDRRHIEYVRLPLDEGRLHKVTCWADALADLPEGRGVQPLSHRCIDLASTADDAYDALFAPLAPRITGRNLIIVPHGVLHYVPFAALHDRQRNRYLIEDYVISYAPSATILELLEQRERSSRPAALVLGDPVALSSDLHLAGAREEASDVAEALGTTARVGDDAKESLLHQVNDVAVLHIAAHGFYDATNPSFSSIALAPGDGEDGNLEVHELLSDLDLSRVGLVVLSACSSGVGRRSGGDEIVGLTRAFLYAGASSVIATLWNIDDKASRDLMHAFYCRLLTGEPAAESLRDAQLELLHQRKYSDPKFWAAYTLTGDAQTRWPF